MGRAADASRPGVGLGLAQPGLHYCRGLFKRYVGDANEAVKAFNLARRDAEFGARALEHMVELSLYPDGYLGAALPQDDGGSGAADGPQGQAAADGLARAEKLLAELEARPDARPGPTRVLRGYALLAARARPGVERALKLFEDMAAQDVRPRSRADRPLAGVVFGGRRR